ncbi:chaperonin 10-like protein [Penicillium brevicompactum]|uniref:chaperonin 10-like protein n=1 Tax=Penicillium brevicompactum TaxID=5074 RepID=UPI002541972E|nr:chaperonin 10-like protein [Penicillium brevicompactum]KAJ5336906.1 chaperonin 10-like protein [Penicillium brevicompactum]
MLRHTPYSLAKVTQTAAGGPKVVVRADHLLDSIEAVVIDNAQDPLSLRDVELQHPSSHEVLVKILACGLCYTDVHTASGHMGDVFPRVPGHEFIGHIVEQGADVEDFQLGDLVGGAFHAGHDSICRQCLRNNVQHCNNREISGISRNGGLAEYALLRAEAAVRLPSGINVAEVAPLLCAGLTVFNGIRRQQLEPGALIAVQGLGGLGHLAVQYARKMGYEVTVLSSSGDKESFAMSLGAHHYINSKLSDIPTELEKLGGADLIVQTAPGSGELPKLIGGLASGGTLLLLAPTGNMEVLMDQLVMKGQKIEGWLTGGPRDAEDTVKFAMEHNIRCMIENYKLKDVQYAVDSLVSGKPRFRNVLIME